MSIRRYVKYLDWLLLALVMVILLVLNDRAEQQFDMVTKYNPLWVFQVNFFGPLVTTVYFIWKYRLIDDGKGNKFLFCVVVTFFMVSIVWLSDALPRFVLLVTVPAAASSALLQDLDVEYVNRHYAKTTYIGSNIGIRYGGDVLRFRSSRTNYFLLADERCIRAEIGQAAPGFYYIRNLQCRPGEREQAQSDYWAFFWQSGEGIFLVGCLSIALVCWLSSLLVEWRKKIYQ